MIGMGNEWGVIGVKLRESVVCFQLGDFLEVRDKGSQLTMMGLDAHAMNEVNIHRGKDPHLAIVEVFVDGRFLTEGVV